MNIYEKLMNIQQELKAPKGQYNSFSNFKYRSCEDILEAVKPLLKLYKCILTISDNLENIGERYYIKATAKLTDIETGDTYENVAFAREEETKKGMDGSQITGATSSYARKYALNGLFAIDDTKDADTDEYQKQTKKVEKEPTYREQLIAYCKDKQLDLKEISESYELNKESTEEDYKKALTNLKVGE